MIVCFPPNVVACSAIYLAARVMNYPLPKSLEWWKIFGVRFLDMQYVMASILELYDLSSDPITTEYVESTIKALNDFHRAKREEEIKALKEEGRYEKQTKWAPAKAEVAEQEPPAEEEAKAPAREAKRVSRERQRSQSPSYDDREGPKRRGHSREERRDQHRRRQHRSDKERHHRHDRKKRHHHRR